MSPSVEEYHAAMQRLRDELDEEQAFKQERYGNWEPDYCRKCDRETRRVDRLCTRCHQAAVDARRPT